MNDDKLKKKDLNSNQTEEESEIIEDDSIEISETSDENQNNDEIKEDSNEDVNNTEDSLKEENKPNKTSRKERRITKLKNKYIYGNDINYLGMLSYRHLRILAWITFAMTQIAILINMGHNILDKDSPMTNWYYFFSLVGGISTPLFLVATFSRVFNRSNSYKSIIFLYLGLFLAIGIGFDFIVGRYIVGFLSSSENSFDDMSITIGDLLGNKIQMNVFADLLFITLFSFFVNYNPKKYFQGKKIRIFRLFSLIPLVYIALSYILSVLNSFGYIELRYYFYPFLLTKAPLVHIIFIIIALWFKNRERLFIKLGSTSEYYNNVFLNTKRNSLSYSVKISILFTIFAVLDFVLFVGIALIFANYYDDEMIGIAAAVQLQFGECVTLILAIPFILLFSYTKTYKDTKLDLMIPIAGIGLTVLVYVEGLYQIFTKLMAK